VRRPRHWINPGNLNVACEVTRDEVEAALKAARRGLLRGKRPVSPGETPHLILTIGAPGAGKSTVAAAVAARRPAPSPGKAADYVTIDFDVAVKYHPRYKDVWNAPSVRTGKPTGVGFTMGYLACNAALVGILIQIYQDILHSEGGQYNIILQSHVQANLIQAKLAGYRTTLLFVGVPLRTALRRARTRAAATGKFLAPTLAAQDETVTRMWTKYLHTAAWYGMWADEFLVADNGRTAKSGKAAGARASRRVATIPLRCAPRRACRTSWEERLAVAQKAIDAACGVGGNKSDAAEPDVR
jgi:hypothetical protein